MATYQSIFVLSIGEHRVHFATINGALERAARDGFTKQVDRGDDRYVILMNPDERAFCSVAHFTLWP